MCYNHQYVISLRPKYDKERFQQSNSRTNKVNLIENTNELYINASHNMGGKIPQTISYNHIKIIGSKLRKHQEHSILSTNSH